MQSGTWKRLLPLLRYNQLYQSTLFASSFHSTSVSFAKRNTRWASKVVPEGASKKYEKFIARQQRAEAKRALADYLLFGKSSHPHFQNANVNSSAKPHDIPRVKSKNKKLQGSSHSRKREHNGYKKRKNKWEFDDEDNFVHPEKIFEAMFGRLRGFNWSNIPWEDLHKSNPSYGYRWTHASRSEKTWERVKSVGSPSDRVILGLPHIGPLNLDDVKTAFRASALKWHPDKHQGSSQAVAGEKFRLCVNAYNSLCNDLKTT